MSRPQQRSTGRTLPGTRPVVRKSRTNLYLTLGIVAVALLLIGGVLLLNRPSDSEAAATGGHALSTGPAGAPELVEYIDFQCESCHAFHDNITQRLAADYDGRVDFTVRLFPLPGHPLGQPAAQAAEAAALQGDFVGFYTTLFEEYETWAGHSHGATTDDLAAGRAYFIDVAERLGLDVDRFVADMDSAAVVRTVQESVAGGQALGVTSTPTFFLDGERFGESANSYAEFDQQLRAALDERVS